MQLGDTKPILKRLQEIVVSEQLLRYCEAVRPCPRCHRRRHLKDYRRRRYDTVFGRLVVGAPRFDGCRHCGEGRITSSESELLPEADAISALEMASDRSKAMKVSLVTSVNPG